MMRRPADTSEDAKRRQTAAYRAMTPEARLRLIDSMSQEVRVIAKAGGLARASRGRRNPAVDAPRSSGKR